MNKGARRGSESLRVRNNEKYTVRKQTTIGGLFSFVPYFYDDEPRLFFLRYP